MISWFVRENHNPQHPLIQHGWGNGYVILNKDHPDCGKNYDDIDVSVHGGLTFGQKVDSLGESWIPEDIDYSEDSWVYGFDTSHYDDDLTKWTKEDVELETIRLCYQLEGKLNKQF